VVALALAVQARGLLVDVAGGRAGPAEVTACRPEKTLADLAQAGPALGTGIETVAVEHPAGMRLLAAPSEPDLLEAVQAGWGTALVRETRSAAAVTVFDCGLAVSGAAREALVAADRVLLVCRPDEVSMAAARALITAATRWSARGAVGVVVNRWSRRADVGVRSLSRGVGAPVVAVVRDDPRRMQMFDTGRLDLARWAWARPMGALEGLAAETAS
jgi:MinD-like ATPase involved in chromosome partitioning or flagellar assembly